MASQLPKLPEISLDSIDKGIARVEEKKVADARDLLEIEGIKTVQLQNKLARSKIKNVKADRTMRKKYAGRILLYLEIYSGIVGTMVITHGFKLWDFALPEVVLASLVGSTAIAAIGLVGFVARGLFKAPPENPPS